jgi:integrase
MPRCWSTKSSTVSYQVRATGGLDLGEPAGQLRQRVGRATAAAPNYTDYAGRLVANGVDIRSLADHLGHTDPGFTLRVYTHLMPYSEEKTRKAIDLALGAAVDGLPSSPVPGLYREGA